MVSTPTVAYAAARRKRPPAAQRKFRLFFRRINREKFFKKPLAVFNTGEQGKYPRCAPRRPENPCIFVKNRIK
jgi:hypothetical protein